VRHPESCEVEVFNELKAVTSAFNRRYPSPTIRAAAQVDRRVAIAREAGFIYFRVPKAANSTVTATLYTRLTGEKIDLSASSSGIRRYFARAHTLSRAELQDLRSHFYLFSFVRDPYSRLASAYLEKVRRASREGRAKQIVHRYYRRDLDAEVSFLEFCAFLEERGLYKDAHWYPQVTFIPIGADQLHFLGRVESLDEDLRRVFRDVFHDETVAVASKVRHATGATERMKSLYCKATVEIVQRVYRADFADLGYPTWPDWARSLGED
jgi:hypothetical protein